MAISRILLGGSAKSDVGGGNHENGSISHLHGAAINAVNRVKVMTIASKDLPAVALKALLRIVGHAKRG